MVALTRVAGLEGLSGYTGDGVLATTTRLNLPAAVCADALGNLYIGDTMNHCIRRVDALTQIITTVAGIPGVSTETGNGGLATAATMYQPTSLKIDRARNFLYVISGVDPTVRKINLNTGIISHFAGDPLASSIGDGGPATAAQLLGLNCVFVGPNGDVYISHEAAIRKVDVDTGIITTVVGTHAYGFNGDGLPPLSTQIDVPGEMAMNAAGELIWGDTFFLRRIRKIRASDNTVITLIGDGTAAVGGNGGLAVNGTIYLCAGIEVDTAQNIFFLDLQEVRRIDAVTGIVDLYAGGVLNTEILYPSDIEIGPNGELYIANTTPSTILRGGDPLPPPTACCHGSAGDLITALRPMLSDNVAPYTHSDTALLQWLSDGQRLIAQLVPEAFPRTELFTPTVGSARQRLDATDAYALIRVEQNHGATLSQNGAAIPAVARDVYDTFDPDWMSRTPSPVPAAPNYFDGFCFDYDDPLGFFLHPKPTNADNKVYVTYAASPQELTLVADCMELPSMYHSALINYVIYRAASSQTQGYAPAAAARAIERFGQQLNLPRDTILRLIGEPRRQSEQQQ